MTRLISSGPMAALAGWSFITCLAALRLVGRPLLCRRRSRRLDRWQSRIECRHDIVRDVEVRAAGERLADFDQHVGAALLHHLCVDRAELIGDLLLDVLVIALDLLLLPGEFLLRLLLLGLERTGTALEGSVGFLALQCVDGSLDRLAFGLQRSSESVPAVLEASGLAAQGRRGGLARVA